MLKSHKTPFNNQPVEKHLVCTTNTRPIKNPCPILKNLYFAENIILTIQKKRNAVLLKDKLFGVTKQKQCQDNICL